MKDLTKPFITPRVVIAWEVDAANSTSLELAKGFIEDEVKRRDELDAVVDRVNVDESVNGVGVHMASAVEEDMIEQAKEAIKSGVGSTGESDVKGEPIIMAEADRF